MRFRRTAFVTLLLFIVLALSGASYEALSWRAEVQRSPRPGKLIDAGNLRLNLYCLGEGSPTVVLESGLADSLDSWKRVQPEIARFARVCSYDRAGYGYSSPGPMPRTANRIASELHSALQSAGEKPPFLLAGHSFGGFLARVFNGKFPDDVMGLVLIDSTQEDQYRLLPAAWTSMGAASRLRAQRQAFWAPLYIGLGIARLQLAFAGQQAPPVILQSKYLKARTSEFENIEVSAEQARASDHLSDKPLIVLTAGKPIDAALHTALSAADQNAYAETWIHDLQSRLTHLSARGKQVILPDSRHDVPKERPEAIVSAVRELCSQYHSR